jgi:hypothetical protein
VRPVLTNGRESKVETQTLNKLMEPQKMKHHEKTTQKQVKNGVGSSVKRKGSEIEPQSE